MFVASRRGSWFFSVSYNCIEAEIVFFVLGASKLVFCKGEEEVFFLWFFVLWASSSLGTSKFLSSGWASEGRSIFCM